MAIVIIDCYPISLSLPYPPSLLPPLPLPPSLSLSLSFPLSPLTASDREHNACLRAELDALTEIPSHHLLLNLLGVCVSGSTGKNT